MKIIEPKVELWQQGDDSKAYVAKNLNLLDMVMEKVVQMIGCINK